MVGEESFVESESGMWKPCAMWLGWAMTVATMLISSAPAHAFYWYGWPGSGIPPERTIVGPPSSSSPPSHTSKPPSDGSGSPPRVPVGLPVVVTAPPPTNLATPEPATGLAAVVGIGILAAGRAWRRHTPRSTE